MEGVMAGSYYMNVQRHEGWCVVGADGAVNTTTTTTKKQKTLSPLYQWH